MPKKTAGPCAVSIAFEPIVPETIKPHHQSYVIPAAVSDRDGLTTMTIYNYKGVSSSLSKASADTSWNNNKRRDGKVKIVPLVSFSTVLNMIPPNIPITYIMTDMQGHDFDSVSSGGDLLAKRNVTYLETEIIPEISSHYVNISNDLCRDWLPFMTSIGYVLDFARYDRGNIVPGFENTKVASKTCEAYLEKYPTPPPQVVDNNSYNALWRLASVPIEKEGDFSVYNHPKLWKRRTHPNLGVFSDEEYSKCVP